MAEIKILLTPTEAILLNEGWPDKIERDLNLPTNIETVSQQVPPNCPARSEGKVFIRAGKKLPSKIYIDSHDRRWFLNCFRPNRRWGACSNCILASPIGGVDPKYASTGKP